MIIVFLCSYNGERFITEQIQSIANQTARPIQLIVSDDGSSDNTLELVAQAQRDNSELNILLKEGPRRGFQYNFMSLFDDDIPAASYYAFSDQDDIWEPEKLERALKAIERYPNNQPTLYTARSRLVNEQNQEIGFSPLFKKEPTFANALVQCIGGGSTMVFNRRAWEIMRAAPIKKIVSHDWWMYQMITAIGGNVIYDPIPTLRYRQHGNNVMGANTSWVARVYRIDLLLRNRFRDWNDLNTESLALSQASFANNNAELFEYFVKARRSTLWDRLRLFRKSSVYRQTRLGTIGLWVAIVLGKC